MKKIMELIKGRPATGIPVSSIKSSVHTVQVAESGSLYDWGYNIREQLFKMQKEKL